MKQRLWALLFLGLFAQLPLAHAESDAPQFLPFPIIIVNTLDGPRVTGLFSVTVQLHTNSVEAFHRLEKLRPLIQDALTRTTIDLGQNYVDPRDPLPFKLIELKLQAAAQQVAPKEKLRVLIINASTRPS